MAGLTIADLGSSPPLISQRLCRKAVDHNDQLTNVERILFLSRLDLSGKTLAYPESLSEMEVDEMLGRPPPAVLRSNIKLVTGLNSVAEVLRDYWSPDRTDKLSYDALHCITTQWWTPHTDEIYRTDSDVDEEDLLDGVIHAAGELAAALRPEETAFEKAATSRFLSDDSTSVGNDGDLISDQGPERSEEEWLQERERWLQQREQDTAKLRADLQIRLEEELQKTTQDDVAAMKELQERMRVEVDEDE